MDQCEKIVHREAELQRRSITWKRIISATVSCVGTLLGIVPNCDGAVCVGHLTLEAEIPTIRIAAERNGIFYGSDDWYLLLAIRLSENGAEGYEFGVVVMRDTNLETQAAWAAATIMKQHGRFGSEDMSLTFVCSLADRYCPKSCDPDGNYNWKINVWYWFEMLKREVENHE